MLLDVHEFSCDKRVTEVTIIIISIPGLSHWLVMVFQAADKEEASSGCIRSEGDLFVIGAQAGLMAEDGEFCMFHPSEYYPTWTIEPPTDSLKQVLQHCTGWQCVPRPADHPLAAQ
jgi:hypothetical protein